MESVEIILWTICRCRIPWFKSRFVSAKVSFMWTRKILFAAALISAPGASTAVQAAEDSQSTPLDFNRDIRPILSDKCYFCHGPDPEERKADFRLDIEADAKADLGGYFAIVSGQPEKSELVHRITTQDVDDLMPPPESGKELTSAEISKIRQWIAQGATYEVHWAYQALKRPDVPAVKNSSWSTHPVDQFILNQLESKGLTPGQQADPNDLVRRLSFDLTGLPPTPDQVRAFESGPSASQYSAWVQSFLNSPHYGERMAVYWLDLVRYADTVGYHGDQEHNISPYRDYVIKSFNDNKPFDQFTREQLAGDLLPEGDLWTRIATGYNRVLQTTHEGGAQDKEYLAKYAADRVRNVSSVWLGATVGCAECHSHKYDPYTQKQFYQLAAFFADVKEQGAFNSPNSSPTVRNPEIDAWNIEQAAEIKAIESEVEQLRLNDSATNSAKLKELEERREEIRSQFRKTMVTVSAEPRTMRVLNRGDWMDESGEIVQPDVPQFLSPMSLENRPTRLDLANWLTDSGNPLTARVFVNRIWYLLFGEGLSRSLDDFGSQGEAPSHPELLDWLAVDFMESGWDVKRLIHTITTSKTYQLSSLPTETQRRLDPSNIYLSRQNRFRLTAEFIRDNALAISGLLAPDIGGHSVKPYQPAGYYQHLNFPQRKYTPDIGEAQYRRGVYMHWQRIFLHPMLKAFDAPTREECTARRPTSNTPLAALNLLNDPTFVEAARIFAQRMLKEGGASQSEKLVWAWKTALSRTPSSEEIAAMTALLNEELRFYMENPGEADELNRVGMKPKDPELDSVKVAAWTSIARVIFNLNEWLTRN